MKNYYLIMGFVLIGIAWIPPKYGYGLLDIGLWCMGAFCLLEYKRWKR